jgi:nicotinate-nucleotide adenylyltransferase
MTKARKLGLLGGTFDPIHYGHLDAADAASAALALDEVVFIPSHDPPHRPIDPRATAFHRFALTALAVNDRPEYRVSDVELQRQGHSYTIDTLRTLHADGWLPSQLFFILGADAFAEIATWKEFPGVLDAANFAVIARPGTTLEQALTRTPQLRGRARDAAAHDDSRRETLILLVQADTRDVSSTAIRERLAAHRSIEDVVPRAVARHILAHHLYEAVGSLHGEDAYESR